MGLALVLLLLAQDVPLAETTVPDAELAKHRGGIMLPNGVDVSLTVQTQTSVNGAIVLRSVFRADQGAPSLTVYAPKPGETVAAGSRQEGAGTGSSPTITFDSRNGLQVIPGNGRPNVAITSGNASTVGLEKIQAGGSTMTDNGVVSQAVKGGLQTAELRAADLAITHLAGTAFGSAIANSGSDRAIDTTTTVAIDLRNLDATTLASAMLRVEDVATNAMLTRQ